MDYADPLGGGLQINEWQALSGLLFLFSASGPNKFVPSAPNKNAPAKPGPFIDLAEREGNEPALQYVGYQILADLEVVVSRIWR